MQLFGLCHIGRVRQNNEDCLRIEPDLNTVIVADGMGGANAGEVASAITVETIIAYLRNPPETLAVAERIKEAIRAANAKVWQTAQQRPECSGMGSTIVVASWEGDHIWIQNAGDSRAYRLRNGELSQLSYDQNVGNELRHSLGLTPEQVRKYPQRNVLTMAVGVGSDILVRCYDEAMEPGDTYLLCSDGLYGPVKGPELLEIMKSPLPLPALAAALVDRANANGGPDNITVALMRQD